jgi:hypothetical protein
MKRFESAYAFFASKSDGSRLVNLGKTRIFNSPSLLALIKRNTMTELLKQIADFINPESAPQATPAPGVAQNLMERAEADAGRNPAEAENLRGAARAFLSVVR